MTATHEIVIPRELPHQEPALRSPARYKLIRAGIRWGKSRLALIAAVSGHGPGDCFRGIADGVDIAWIVRDYPQARAIWREEIVPRFDRNIPGVEVNHSEHRVTLKGAGTLEIRTAENIISVLGKRLGGVVVDEAAFLDLEDVWERVLRGRLIDLGGWALFISSPNGGQDGNADKIAPSYFNRLCEKQIRGELGESWAQFHGTTRDNPKLPRVEVERMYAEYPLDSPLIAQNLDAKLITGGMGVAFPEWSHSLHTQPPTPEPDWKWFAGFDYGYHPDPAAFVLLAAAPETRVVVRWDCEWKRTTPYDVGRSIGLQLRERLYGRSVGGRPVPCPELDYIVYDSAMRNVTDGGETQVEKFEAGLRSVSGFRCPALIPSPKGADSPITHKILVHEMLKYDRSLVQPDGSLPSFARPRLQVHEDAVNLRRTLPTLPLDERDPNRVDTKADDHAYDALRYALAYRVPEVAKRETDVPEGKHPGYNKFGERIKRDWQKNQLLEELRGRGGFTNGMGMTGFRVFPREDA